jgi:hypothetical protein
VVATVGISPATVALTVGQTRQLTATPRDTNGVLMTGVTMSWVSSDESIATVNASGVVTAIAAGSATIRAISSNGVSSPESAITVTPAVTVVGDFAIIEDALGPTLDEIDIPTDVPAFWITNLKTTMAASIVRWGYAWDAGNSISGYDRAAICYMLYKITQDPIWLAHGHAYAVNYRDGYLIPAEYSASPHWSQMEGLYLHWKLTGDTASRDAVLIVASKFTGAFAQNDSWFGIPQSEGRIQARTLLAMWLAEKINGVTDANLTPAIVKAMADMNADGWTPFSSTCGGSLNYMNGMLWDVLTRLRLARPDAAYNTTIDTNVVAFGNYLWDSQWRGVTPGDSQSFNYISLECTGTGSPSPAVDLNGLIVPVFGYLGKYVDASWFTKGDQVFAAMAGAFIDVEQGYRQFSENYTSSYRYLGYKFA